MQYENVLLNSGGMDSLLVGTILKAEISVVHVFCDVGQKYFEKEYASAIKIAKACNAPLIEVKASLFANYEDLTSGIIPFRNAELILNGAQYANVIWLGVLAEEVNSDKSPEFFNAILSVLNISHRKQYWTNGETFEIMLPLKNINKTQAVIEYLKNGNSLNTLLETVSCYNDTEKHCGNCSSCFKRWVALTNATNIPLDNHFIKNPALWKTKQEWKEKFKGYSNSRIEEIQSAFKIVGM